MRWIHRAKHRRWKHHLYFWIYGLIALFEAVVIVFSLGFLSSEARADYLFSDFMDDVPTRHD